MTIVVVVVVVVIVVGKIMTTRKEPQGVP